MTHSQGYQITWITVSPTIAGLTQLYYILYCNGNKSLCGIGQRKAIFLSPNSISKCSMCAYFTWPPVKFRNCISSLLKQGEDVVLPEVPTEPLPEVPEAAKAEPGTGHIFILDFYSLPYWLTVVGVVCSREERSKEGRESDAGCLKDWRFSLDIHCMRCKFLPD